MVLFTDADIAFPPDYFRQIASLPLDDVTPFKNQRFRRTNMEVHTGGFSEDNPGWTDQNSGRIRIELAHPPGGLPEGGRSDPELPCTEDSELGWRLRQKGYSIHFLPESKSSLRIIAAGNRDRLKSGCITFSAEDCCIWECFPKSFGFPTGGISSSNGPSDILRMGT